MAGMPRGRSSPPAHLPAPRTARPRRQSARQLARLTPAARPSPPQRCSSRPRWLGWCGRTAGGSRAAGHLDRGRTGPAAAPTKPSAWRSTCIRCACAQAAAVAVGTRLQRRIDQADDVILAGADFAPSAARRRHRRPEPARGRGRAATGRCAARCARRRCASSDRHRWPDAPGPAPARRTAAPARPADAPWPQHRMAADRIFMRSPG